MVIAPRVAHMEKTSVRTKKAVFVFLHCWGNSLSRNTWWGLTSKIRATIHCTLTVWQTPCWIFPDLIFATTLSGGRLYDPHSSDEQTKAQSDWFAQGHRMTSNNKFKDSGSGEDKVFCFYLVMGAGRELQKIKKQSMRNVFLEAPSEATVFPWDSQAAFPFLSRHLNQILSNRADLPATA